MVSSTRKFPKWTGHRSVTGQLIDETKNRRVRKGWVEEYSRVHQQPAGASWKLCVFRSIYIHSAQSEIQNCCLTTRGVAKEVIWRTRLKRMRTDTFFFGRVLIEFFKFHLKKESRVEWEIISSSEVIDCKVKVVKIARAVVTSKWRPK